MAEGVGFPIPTIVPGNTGCGQTSSIFKRPAPKRRFFSSGDSSVDEATGCFLRHKPVRSDPRLRPACSKPHICRTCLNVKVVAAENMTIKRCRCHVMANLITVLFGGVNCRQGNDLSVIFLYNAKLETHTKDDYCFIVIPKLCFHCMLETGDEAFDVPID